MAGPSGSELRFAAVYGYRHIQNLVASIERGTCPYHYVSSGPVRGARFCLITGS